MRPLQRYAVYWYFNQSALNDSRTAGIFILLSND